MKHAYTNDVTYAILYVFVFFEFSIIKSKRKNSNTSKERIMIPENVGTKYLRK